MVNNITITIIITNLDNYTLNHHGKEHIGMRLSKSILRHYLPLVAIVHNDH